MGVTNKNVAHWKRLQAKYLVPLLQHRMSLIEAEQLDPYMNQLFEHFCIRRNNVNFSCINLEMEFMAQSLLDILFIEKKSYKLNIDNLLEIFPNLISAISPDGEALNLNLYRIMI